MNGILRGLLACAFTGTWLVPAGKLQAQEPPFPEDRRAEVSAKQVVFSFPLPYTGVHRPAPAISGQYAWRVTIEQEPSMSFVLSTPGPIASDRDKDIVGASTLRLCPSNTSPVEDCTRLIKGNGRANVMSIRIELREPELVNKIIKARPEAYWRTVIEPGGHYQVDQLFFWYKN